MKYKDEDPDNLGGLGGMLPAEVLKMLNELLEQQHRTGHPNNGSKIEVVYVAPGAQNIGHLDSQTIVYQGGQDEYSVSHASEEESSRPKFGSVYERIRHCIELLMQDKYSEKDGDKTVVGPLFNQQSHWQAIYRDLVDKDYCEDSDFDGFDVLIRKSMPDKVNKPYSKASVKQISQTDFSRPFQEWKFDPEISKTRKPFDRMFAVSQRFLEILEENGL